MTVWYWACFGTIFQYISGQVNVVFRFQFQVLFKWMESLEPWSFVWEKFGEKYSCYKDIWLHIHVHATQLSILPQIMRNEINIQAKNYRLQDPWVSIFPLEMPDLAHSTGLDAWCGHLIRVTSAGIAHCSKKASLTCSKGAYMGYRVSFVGILKKNYWSWSCFAVLKSKYCTFLM